MGPPAVRDGHHDRRSERAAVGPEEPDADSRRACADVVSIFPGVTSIIVFVCGSSLVSYILFFLSGNTTQSFPGCTIDTWNSALIAYSVYCTVVDR
ncbi:hypothetical protein DAEQUDRAFT_732224 [Daedalea quercina L-15889]|uniref:Uncharacterized protein n=1 Tax=Daedalea quercina L-15889 TaxID=1314783 RepID=A0A165LRU5_9APHY|nr:hypothetical protein DAEQUDRAFT_732224 [Daedalea quercina L-15889]